MTRMAWLLPIMLVLAGAGPRMLLPVPPIPPLHPPGDEAAPLPDQDIAAPALDASQGPRFTLHDFRVNRFNNSPGYTPGSRFETSEEKRPIQTPGLSVRFPLQ
jgi:hypothetical protein